MSTMTQDGEGSPPQSLLAPRDEVPDTATKQANYNFRKYDQKQQFLVPVSMNDWVGKGSKVRFVDALFNRLDKDGALDPIYQSYRADGWGAPAYDPLMMVKILFYGTCYGILSSRKLAWLTEVNMELRYLSGNQTPNFRTICEFRNRHNSVLGKLFVDILQLCSEAELVSVGRVALDGTKVKANASLEKSFIRKTIARKIKELLEEAELIDEREDDDFSSRRGDLLPEDLHSENAQQRVIEQAMERLAKARRAEEKPSRRKSKRKGGRKRSKSVPTDEEQEPVVASESTEPTDEEAGADEGHRPTPPDLNRLERMLDAYGQASEKEQEARQKQQAKIEQRKQEEAESGKKKRGRKPTAPEDIRFPDRQGNITDPDSRIMLDGHGNYLQGYNCQAAVTCAGHKQIITACGVTKEETDHHQLIPMMEASEQNAGVAGQWLADAGYYTDEHVQLYIGDTELLVNTKKGWRLLKEMRERGCPRGPIPKDLTKRERMERKLSTKTGHRAYSDRFNVESIFGQFETRGFDRFFRRGIEKVETDWSTICSSSNILKLYNSGNWSISDGYLKIEPVSGLT